VLEVGNLINHEVVLYAMLYGTVPFKASNMNDLHKLIIKAKYTLKDDICEDAKSLLQGLLEPDPKKRLTIPQIKNHAWLQNVSESSKTFVYHK
jgi:serine/threonine protein kinase